MHTSDYYAPDSYPGNKGLQFRWKRLHPDLGSDRDEVRFGEWNELKIGGMNMGRGRDTARTGRNELVTNEKRV